MTWLNDRDLTRGGVEAWVVRRNSEGNKFRQV